MYIANILVRVIVTYIFLMDPYLPQTPSEQTGVEQLRTDHTISRGSYYSWYSTRHHESAVCPSCSWLTLILLLLTHFIWRWEGSALSSSTSSFQCRKWAHPAATLTTNDPTAITPQHEAWGPSLFLCSQLFSVIFHHFTLKCSALFGPCWPHLVSVLFSLIFCLHDKNAKNSQARCCPHSFLYANYNHYWLMYWLFSFINDW